MVEVSSFFSRVSTSPMLFQPRDFGERDVTVTSYEILSVFQVRACTASITLNVFKRKWSSVDGMLFPLPNAKSNEVCKSLSRYEPPFQKYSRRRG